MTTRPPLLLFLTRALDFGGAERQLVTLVLRLHRMGIRVRVAVFYAGGGLEPELHAAGVPVQDLRKGGRWDLPGFLARLIRLVRRERPAILHGYLTVPNLLAVALKPVTPGMQAVMGVRASNMDLGRYDRLSRLTARIERGLSGWADRVIVNSRAGRDHLLAQGWAADRLRVVPNGIDTERFRPDPAARRAQRTAWGLPDTIPLIGLIGRLDPMKDHAGFLGAAARIRVRHPEARFLCLGDGRAEERRRLERMTRELGLADRVDWREGRAEMAPVYAALDVLVSASRFGEGFSNVIGEAMASGVACVVTDVGDSAWILADPDRVVPPGDADALAGAVERVLGLAPRERVRLGQRDRRRIVTEFGVASLADRTLAALGLSVPESSP